MVMVIRIHTITSTTSWEVKESESVNSRAKTLLDEKPCPVSGLDLGKLPTQSARDFQLELGLHFKMWKKTEAHGALLEDEAGKMRTRL